MHSQQPKYTPPYIQSNDLLLYNQYNQAPIKELDVLTFFRDDGSYIEISIKKRKKVNGSHYTLPDNRQHITEENYTKYFEVVIESKDLESENATDTNATDTNDTFEEDTDHKEYEFTYDPISHNHYLGIYKSPTHNNYSPYPAKREGIKIGKKEGRDTFLLRIDERLDDDHRIEYYTHVEIARKNPKGQKVYEIDTEIKVDNDGFRLVEVDKAEITFIIYFSSVDLLLPRNRRR